MESYLKSGYISGSHSGSDSCSIQAETDFHTCVANLPAPTPEDTDAEICTYYTGMVNCYPTCACSHVDVQHLEDSLTDCSLPQCGDSKPHGLSTADGWSVSEIVVASFGAFIALIVGTTLWSNFSKKKKASEKATSEEDDESANLLPKTIHF